MKATAQERDLVLEVAERITGAEGVIVLHLRDPSGAQLPEWSPGAHVDLILPGGLTRQYSLCGDPADRSIWRIGILREPVGRGGSEHVHSSVFPGDRLQVRGPRNHFELRPSPRYVFIAGGIGITPILPMMLTAQRAGAAYELHYGGRSRRSMAFLEALDSSSGGQVTLHPQDEVGLIDLARVLGVPQEDCLVYCCGPEPLLKAVEQHCADWPAGSLHVERFAPREVGPPRQDAPFEVELARSRQSVMVPPEKSVLDVIEAAGLTVFSSCREGTCGTCETGVLEGEVDHRDSLLTPAEQAANDVMFICVSRAACPRLVLDL